MLETKYEIDGRPQRGYWSILVGTSSCGPFDYRSAWTYLTGVATGAEQSRRPESHL
ncbi:hypothetical protein G4X40_19850 [Rhodococcus sp. D2-41]|uniref:hypothetical protein n=1 Tax=Speluncibacter jeojiensis TaxID=2710754 RepID=UPI00240FF2F0|nr:hypothetical protein [Rhodococcus sp. D2-41]MDG3012398.1 hypothetical protein [Rhodococcus sp. D2-41]